MTTSTEAVRSPRYTFTMKLVSLSPIVKTRVLGLTLEKKQLELTQNGTVENSKTYFIGTVYVGHLIVELLLILFLIRYPVTRILARLPRCMGMLAKILARSCQDLTKATMIMQDHGKADHASYQAYQDFPCILPSFSMCLAKHTKIFLSILPIQPGFFHAFCKAFQDFR